MFNNIYVYVCIYGRKVEPNSLDFVLYLATFNFNFNFLSYFVNEISLSSYSFGWPLYSCPKLSLSVLSRNSDKYSKNKSNIQTYVQIVLIIYQYRSSSK